MLAVEPPLTHSVLVNNEDGKLYRWDTFTNTFTEVMTLTAGIGLLPLVLGRFSLNKYLVVLGMLLAFIGASCLLHGVFDLIRERKLDEEAVDRVIAVQLDDGREHVVLRGVGRKLEVACLHSRLLRGLLLQVDIDVRRRIVANEDGGEADVAELRNRRRNLLAHLRAERLAVDERCGHEARL